MQQRLIMSKCKYNLVSSKKKLKPTSTQSASDIQSGDSQTGKVSAWQL